ncbi:MAG: excinuclease ABC subunit UvrC [Deferrisomatales bacterium]
MDLQEKVDHFPARPGVYLMRDAQGRVLYVGKAKDLRGRVRTYFREGSDQRPQVRFLMARVADVEPVVTDSEKEALILENTLIKRHRPRYNIDLRDDKTYLSLRFDVQAPFPRLTTVRQVKPDGALYFGPYSSARSLRETVELIHSLFPLRHCTEREFRARERPCLYCQIRGCRAPCCGLVGEAEYRALVDQVVLFLKGRRGELLDGLRAAMAAAAARQAFEEAARLRDRIRAIELTLERQKAVTHDPVDRDVVGLTREGSEAQFAVLVVRAGNLIDRRAYYFADLQADDPEVVTQFLQQYYRGDRIVPGEVLVPVNLGEGGAALGEWLAEKRGLRVRLAHPRRGEKAELLAMAGENARELLAERRRTKVGYEAALRELEERLHLPGPPRRIECYDVSNVQGRDAVASLVTAVDGFAHKEGYRRFVIRTVEGADDTAMLYEALSRGLARRAEPGWALPDLIVVDGGRGQLGAAERALADAAVPGVALAGLAKARTLAGGGESVAHSPERVFLPGRVNPVVLPPSSSGLFLMQRVRDEAHRFALEHHRKRRTRATLSSALDAVPGVGEVRRKALLSHFGSLKRLREASPEELAAVPGISEGLARRILDALPRG